MRLNPVTGIPKLKESGGRIAYLTNMDENAIRAALPTELRALFTASVNSGLRWSEQVHLTWANIDLHTGTIRVPRTKHGDMRHVPINSVVRSLLFDLSLQRSRPDSADEPVFPCRYTQADKLFPKVVHPRRWIGTHGMEIGTRSLVGSSWQASICGRYRSWAGGSR